MTKYASMWNLELAQTVKIYVPLSGFVKISKTLVIVHNYVKNLI